MTRKRADANQRNAFGPVLIFCLIAFALSWPVHLGWTDAWFKAVAGNTIFRDWGFMLAGFGPLIACIVMWYLSPPLEQRVRWRGIRPRLDMAMILLLLGMATLVGRPAPGSMSPHLYGGLFALAVVFYTAAEEAGWRIYLQNKLGFLAAKFRFLLIAIIWWIWHARFQTEFDLFVFPLICLIGGYMIGSLADAGRSVFPAILVHALIVMTTNTSGLGTNQMMALFAVLPIWVIITMIIDRRNRELSS